MSEAKELDYTRQYRTWHDDSDAHFEQEVTNAGNWLSTYWPRDRSAPVLDIGCGTGFVVASFQRAGFQSAEGIDSDRGQVKLAQARNLPVVHVPVVQTEEWSKKRRGRYALVTAIDVLEHIPRQHQLDFLQGVYDLLRPGGMFICRVPNAYSSVASVSRYDDWTHCISFTHRSLDFVLYNTGFSNIRIEATAPLPLSVRLTKPGPWLLACFRLIRRLELAAEFGWENVRDVPLTPNIIAVGEKAKDCGSTPIQQTEKRSSRTSVFAPH
jgi:2-polyprenyl-3-methyl-5-hydroxy-6-metoxy-1,4-benzoquinol methylase